MVKIILPRTVIHICNIKFYELLWFFETSYRVYWKISILFFKNLEFMVIYETSKALEAEQVFCIFLTTFLLSDSEESNRGKFFFCNSCFIHGWESKAKGNQQYGFCSRSKARMLLGPCLELYSKGSTGFAIWVRVYRALQKRRAVPAILRPWPPKSSHGSRH